MNSWQYRYDTGWINRSDWTNVHLGSNTTKNADSNVTHNLNAPLSNLLVKVFISTDGVDTNSFEVHYGNDNPAAMMGYIVYAVDNNNIKVQTGAGGISAITDAGAALNIDAEDWYYKVKVWYLG